MTKQINFRLTQQSMRQLAEIGVVQNYANLHKLLEEIIDEYYEDMKSFHVQGKERK